MSHKDFKDLGFANFPCRNVHYRIHRGWVTRMGTFCPILCFKCNKSIKKKRLFGARRRIGQPVTIFNLTSNMWVFQHINCTSKAEFDDVCSTDGDSDDDSSVSSGIAMSHNAAKGSGGGGDEVSR